jgi:methylmalonyl-CoA mutase cobalamin-binding subunit
MPPPLPQTIAAPDRSSEPAARSAPPAASIHERVLAAVAARICRADDGSAESAGCLELLCASAVASDVALDRALGQMRNQHGLDDAEIVDSYIPAAACQLGADWMENRRSFAEVTIGTARLIRTVRDISAGWNADAAADWRAPVMLMVVPEAEQHRLGAMVAASRFRRLGVSVQMLLGASNAEVLDRAEKGAFDIISFSLATRARVEETRRLIHMMRASLSPLPPLVVGGAIGLGAEELRAHLGADHVASDPEEALRLCGVSIPKPGSARAGPAG